MIKKLCFSLFLCYSFALQAQDTSNKTLELIDDIEQAQDYLISTSSTKSKIVVFNESKHKSQLAKSLFELSKGGTISNNTEYEKTQYKVIEKTWIPCYRISYIYLDGNQLSLNNINAARETIIKKYNDGASFDFLAKQYSMDGNANKGGDSGWFTEGDRTYDFEENIIDDDHNLDEIFTIDISLSKKYYVILKTYDSKNISEIKVLKIVEPIQ
jgi:parvulin-like peptidyl-prolyl isomerase